MSSSPSSASSTISLVPSLTQSVVRGSITFSSAPSSALSTISAVSPSPIATVSNIGMGPPASSSAVTTVAPVEVASVQPNQQSTPNPTPNPAAAPAAIPTAASSPAQPGSSNTASIPSGSSRTVTTSPTISGTSIRPNTVPALTTSGSALTIKGPSLKGMIMVGMAAGFVLAEMWVA